MGALRGSVTQRMSGTSPGGSSFQQRPFIATNARGVPLGDYDTPRAAQVAVEKSCGGFPLRWIRTDLAHAPHWRGEDTLADPADIYGDALQLWARFVPNPSGDGYLGYVLYPGSSTDVRIWGDGSGEEHRLSAPAQANAPTVSLVDDPRLNFVRASADRLTSSYTIPATSGYTLSLVGMAGAGGGGIAYALWVDAATDRVIGESGDVWVYQNDAGVISSGVLARDRLAQVTVVQAVASPPGASMYVDATLVGTNAGISAAGTLLVSTTGASGWNGDLRELVVATQASTPTQLRMLAAYYRRYHPGLT